MDWIRTLSGSVAWTLILISAVTGVAMLWVFGRLSSQKSIRQVKNRLKVHMLELRLFVDEPAIIWQAQKGLLAANGRYMALMLRPFLFLAVPMALMVTLLDPYFGIAPLPVGRAAIVTVQLNQPIDSSGPAPELQVPDGIAVETPAVRMPGTRQVSWRIRPARSTSGMLRVGMQGSTFEKGIEAGDGARYTPVRRVASMFEWLANPGESLLPAGPVQWINVGYPGAEIEWLGLRTHWLVWFVIVSMVAALLFKSRLGVSI